jgi:hypothetical protein
VEAVEKAGNKLLNLIYEAKLVENNRSNRSIKSNPADDTTTTKPLEGAHSATKERYIREKYGDLMYYDKSKHYKHIENDNTPRTPKKQKSLRKFFDRATPEKDKKSIEINSLCSATVASTFHESNSDSQSVFTMPTSSREHAPIHPSGASSVCPTKKGAKKDRNVAIQHQRTKSFDSGSLRQPATDGGFPPDNSFNFDAPENGFGDFNNSESEQPSPTDRPTRRGSQRGGQTLSGEKSMLTKQAKIHSDPRREAFHQSKCSLDFDFENHNDDEDDDPTDPATVNEGGQRGTPESLGNSNSSGLDYRPKLRAAKAAAAPRSGRVGMYSASSRGRSSSRVRDSTSVEPEKQERHGRSGSRARRDSLTGVIGKGKESASASSRGRSSSRIRDSTSVEPDKQGRHARSGSARERNASRSYAPREEVPNVSSRGARTRSRSGSRTRDGTTLVPPPRASTKASSRRGRSVKLKGKQDDLNASSGSLESEQSGNTESSTSRCSSSHSTRRNKSPVAEKGLATPASLTRRSTSNNPRERQERSASRTRTSEKVEARAKLLADSRADLSKEKKSSREAKSVLNTPLGLEGTTKPTTKRLVSKSLQEVLVGSARTEAGSGDASVGVQSLGSASKKKSLTGDYRPKLRATMSGPAGGLGRPLRTQEEIMKQQRRRSICGKDGSGVKKREGRKSDIFASLDREKETVEMTAGPLMRQLPSRGTSDSNNRMARPLILRQGSTRSEFTGPVFGASSGITARRGSKNSQGGIGLIGSTHSQTSMQLSSHSKQRLGSLHSTSTGDSKSSLGSLEASFVES